MDDFRPMEISSKKPVGRFREIIQVPKKVGLVLYVLLVVDNCWNLYFFSHCILCHIIEPLRAFSIYKFVSEVFSYAILLRI